jgi:hypothetical protein
MSKYKIGDTVTWTSKAGTGAASTKLGKIVGIVRRATDVEASPAYHRHYASHKLMIGMGRERDHASYLVSVPHPGRKPRLYWPRVAYLRAA